jgi:hypothetical protein
MSYSNPFDTTQELPEAAALPVQYMATKRGIQHSFESL